MKLYEINKEIESCIDLETGEIIDFEKLEKLQLTRDDKIESLALWVKNLEAEADALKAEKMAFDKRQTAATNKAKSLKQWLTTVLSAEAFKTTKVDIKFRKSEFVEIDENVQIDEKFLRVKKEIDLTAIKAAIKNGEAVNGARLAEGQNIQIK